jgi:uncharacterized membrane protein YqjE
MEAAARTPPAAAEGSSTLGTLRRISETFLNILHNRLELLTVELKEEKHRAVATLFIALLAGGLANLAIVTIVVTIAFLVPESARPWVLIGLSVLLIAATAACALAIKARLKEPPTLCGTLAELKKDIECLKES